MTAYFLVTVQCDRCQRTFEVLERERVAKARVAEVEREVQRTRDDWERAAMTIASMHAAAVGEVRGPDVGVIEDVAAVRSRAEKTEADVALLTAALGGAQDALESSVADYNIVKAALAEARAKAEQYEKDWHDAKYEFGVSMAKACERFRVAEYALSAANARVDTAELALKAATQLLDERESTEPHKGYGGANFVHLLWKKAADLEKDDNAANARVEKLETVAEVAGSLVRLLELPGYGNIRHLVKALAAALSELKKGTP